MYVWQTLITFYYVPVCCSIVNKLTLSIQYIYMARYYVLHYFLYKAWKASPKLTNILPSGCRLVTSITFNGRLSLLSKLLTSDTHSSHNSNLASETITYCYHQYSRVCRPRIFINTVRDMLNFVCIKLCSSRASAEGVIRGKWICLTFTFCRCCAADKSVLDQFSPPYIRMEK